MVELKHNRICELLNVRYPIIQAPMNWITGAELAAVVSNAGGLGTLGPNAGYKTVTRDVAVTGERLRSQIRKVKSITGKPFAVNFPVGVGEGRKYSRRCVEVALEEGIPIAIVSVGPPDVYTRMLKDAGTKILHAVSTADHARKAEDAGVDGIICEGYEGGGHKGLTELTTMTLIRLASEAVKIPIVAGGGIADTRGMVAALALGADGVYMGTRFMAALESDAHPKVKEAIVQCENVCTVSIPKSMILGRNLRNDFTKRYLEMRAAGASVKELQEFLDADKHSEHQALVLGETEEAEIPCGQIAGLISNVISAAEIVQNMVDGIPAVLNELNSKLTWQE
jgi:NAD(P)H-dependent flavin oxidoreductase YrpB (nitropropane dioxygenase family)